VSGLKGISVLQGGEDVNRRQALRALLRSRPVRVDGGRVSPVAVFGAGTSTVRIEAWGGGGGGLGAADDSGPGWGGGE
jgi:hypothetical protein